MKRLEIISDRVWDAPTKRHPTLQKRTVTWRTDTATRYGFKAYHHTWTLDGVNWFDTAKQAKDSSDAK